MLNWVYINTSTNYTSDTFFFSTRIYFMRIWRLKFAKFYESFKNKPEAEISKRMIILSDENLKKYVFNRIELLLPPTAKLSNKTKKPALVIAKCSVLMTVRWTVHEIYISIVYNQKQWTNRKRDMINSFFFNSISRIIQEYFQAKIGRKIRIFSLARKNNILIYKKSVLVHDETDIIQLNTIIITDCLFTTLSRT